MGGAKSLPPDYFGIGESLASRGGERKVARGKGGQGEEAGFRRMESVEISSQILLHASMDLRSTSLSMRTGTPQIGLNHKLTAFSLPSASSVQLRRQISRNPSSTIKDQGRSRTAGSGFFPEGRRSGRHLRRQQRSQSNEVCSQGEVRGFGDSRRLPG